LEQSFLSGRGAGGDSNALQDRLGLLERALQAEISVTRAAVEALAEKPATDIVPLLQRIESVETSLSALTATVERQPAEISASVSHPLVEHLNALTVTRDAQHAAATDGTAETHRRLARIEEALDAHVARAEAAEAAASRERAELRELLEQVAQRSEGFAALTDTVTQDLSEVHDGLSRVHSDHHALATTLDNEAQDAANAFASLAARIENLERAAIKPVEMLESLSLTMDKMHKVTVEKYYRRNRFWYWLFGTDDWLAASWPSQSARIAEELRAVKR
jgi:DNA repair exonuclease SbcCD ATPase subunit